MACFDDSIEDITMNSDNSIDIKHKNFSKPVALTNESAGTQELFCFIYDIVTTLKKGGMLIYDETNRYYHPDIEISLLSLFANKDVNKKNAQIFFASHNHETFDLLNLDQAFVVEKDGPTSCISRLSDIEDLKKRDNVKKKYRLGLLGGIPDTVNFEHKIKQII